MSYTNLSSHHGLGEVGRISPVLEQDAVRLSFHQNEYPQFGLISSEEIKSLIQRYGTENSASTRFDTLHCVRNVADRDQSPIGDGSLCSMTSQAPICREFWKAGNYDDICVSKPTTQYGTGHLHIHPKFLHSNATSHKWVFGAMAELIDNAVDEIQNGATFVSVDKITNLKCETPALLIQDDGGGMTPEAMRHCLSFGFSDKKMKAAIGQYGNGFKTSSMRLGADVVVFSRCITDGILTQSIGLLSYTFLMQTRQERILIPMLDYQFDVESGKWITLHSEEHDNNNHSILLHWSPFTTEDSLLKQCDDIGHHGTRIIIYNLWCNGDGKMELDFESDSEDIYLSGGCSNAKNSSTKEASEHLANRIHYSLRAYLSILYLQILKNFQIILCGRGVEYHSIANDLKFPEFILYKPQNVEGSVLTTIGFLKEAPDVSIHGFNVYHKNRLILPFWRVVTYSRSRGRGVVGVLEANFVEPTHNKQDFEKTPVFLKLETRLKEMTQEYWDYHCGLIGYHVTKKPRPNMTSYATSNSAQSNGIYQPVVLVGGFSNATGAKAPSAAGSTKWHANTSSNNVAGKSKPSMTLHNLCSEVCPGRPVKRKGHGCDIEPERLKRTGDIGSTIYSAHGEDVQHAVDPAKQVEDHKAANIIQENGRLRAQFQQYEKLDKELNIMATQLAQEVQEAHREYAHLLLELKHLEKVKQCNRQVQPGQHYL